MTEREFRYCQCSDGCRKKIYRNNNSNLYPFKIHPNCKLKSGLKKSKNPSMKKLTISDKSKIDKQLDTAWSYLVKLLANNKCEKCGTSLHLNSHHIFSRSNKSVRWNIDNGVCLCAGDHSLNDHSAHKDPLGFAVWIKNKRGDKWYDKLTLMAHSCVKYDLFDKQVMLSHLKTEIKKIENQNK